jgi:acetyltransferase-like isoleucine patch superfamily enzyme
VFHLSRSQLQAAIHIVRARVRLRRCNHVGKRTRLVGRPRITNGGEITIGERVVLDCSVVPIELKTFPGGTIEIGARTFLNYGVSIQARERVFIGQDCLLGTYVNVLDNDMHSVLDRSHAPRSKPVVIEDNVWLGNRVIVLPGVQIGRDAVVGAGSVVVKDVPPRSLAVGNPARVIRNF